MEDIEYLEEYEDLILPTIKSNSGQASHSARSGNSNINIMMQDEDSSSIDQDIFESLFDDHSDEESSVIPKKVNPKLNQRRFDERTSLDSLDLLVKDLVGEQTKQCAQTNPYPSVSGSKMATQLPKKMTSTQQTQNASGRGFQKAALNSKPLPSTQTSAGRSFQKAPPSGDSQLFKRRSGPPPTTKTATSGQSSKITNYGPSHRTPNSGQLTKTSNYGPSSKVPAGGRPSIHKQFPKNTSTSKIAATINTSKPKPIHTNNPFRPDSTKFNKSKSSGTVRPSGQQQQQSRFSHGNPNRSIGGSGSSTKPSSSSFVTSTARKQMSTPLQKKKELPTPPPKKSTQRPPTTIVKPEKREIKDPSEDPLSLDDIADGLLDSDSFTLSDISDDSLHSFSDYEENPNNIIDLSNDESIDDKINHKDLDNIRVETPSPTVSEDREDITSSPSPDQVRTLKQSIIEVDSAEPSPSMKKVPEKVTIISDTLLSRIDTSLLASAVLDDPPNKILEEISSAAEFSSNKIIFSTKSTSKEVEVTNADTLDEMIDDNVIDREETEGEIKGLISEDINSIITDKNESSVFLHEQLDDERLNDQQKENIEVAMEVEVETNEEPHNLTQEENIDSTILADTNEGKEHTEQSGDIEAESNEIIEECFEEITENMDATITTEIHETQNQANTKDSLEEDLKSKQLKRKRSKADSFTSTSSIESKEVTDEKSFKEPLNPRDSIRSKEKPLTLDSTPISQHSLELESPTLPAKKPRLSGRRRFRNLGDGTDTSESEYETTTQLTCEGKSDTEVSGAGDMKNNNKCSSEIPETEAKVETEKDSTICVEKTKDDKNTSSEKNKPIGINVKNKKYVKQNTQDIISKAQIFTKSSRSTASDSNDTEDEKNEQNMNKLPKNAELLPDTNTLHSMHEKIQLVDNKKKNTNRDDYPNSETSTKVKSVEKRNRTTKAESVASSKLVTKSNKMDDDRTDKETQGVEVSSTISESNLESDNKASVPKEHSTSLKTDVQSTKLHEKPMDDTTEKSTSSTKKRLAKEKPESKSNDDSGANVDLLTSSTTGSKLMSAETKLHEPRRSLKLKNVLQSGNVDSSKNSDDIVQEKSLAAKDSLKMNREKDSEQSDVKVEKSQSSTKIARETNEADPTVSANYKRSSVDSNVSTDKGDQQKRLSGRLKGGKTKEHTDQKGAHVTRSARKIISADNDAKETSKSNSADQKIDRVTNSVILNELRKTDGKDSKYVSDNKNDHTTIGPVQISTTSEEKDNVVGEATEAVTSKDLNKELYSKESSFFQGQKSVSKECDKESDGSNYENKHEARKTKTRDGDKVSVEEKELREEVKTTKTENKTKLLPEYRLTQDNTIGLTKVTKMKATDLDISTSSIKEEAIDFDSKKAISSSPLPTRKSVRSNVSGKDGKLVEKQEKNLNITTPAAKKDKEKLQHINKAEVEANKEKKKSKLQDIEESPSALSASPSTRSLHKTGKDEVQKLLIAEGPKSIYEPIKDNKEKSNEFSLKPIKGVDAEKSADIKAIKKSENNSGKSIVTSPPKSNFIVRRNYKNQAISQRPEQFANVIRNKSGINSKEYQESQKIKGNSKKATESSDTDDIPNTSQYKKEMTSQKLQTTESEKSVEKDKAKVTAVSKTLASNHTRVSNVQNLNALTSKDEASIPNSNILSDKKPKTSSEKKQQQVGKAVSTDIIKTTSDKKDDKSSKKMETTRCLKTENLKGSEETLNEQKESVNLSKESQVAHEIDQISSSQVENLNDEKEMKSCKKEVSCDKKETLSRKKEISSDNKLTSRITKKTSCEESESGKKETSSNKATSAANAEEDKKEETLSENREILSDKKEKLCLNKNETSNDKIENSSRNKEKPLSESKKPSNVEKETSSKKEPSSLHKKETSCESKLISRKTEGVIRKKGISSPKENNSDHKEESDKKQTLSDKKESLSDTEETLSAKEIKFEDELDGKKKFSNESKEALDEVQDKKVITSSIKNKDLSNKKETSEKNNIPENLSIDMCDNTRSTQIDVKNQNQLEFKEKSFLRNLTVRLNKSSNMNIYKKESTNAAAQKNKTDVEIKARTSNEPIVTDMTKSDEISKTLGTDKSNTNKNDSKNSLTDTSSLKDVQSVLVSQIDTECKDIKLIYKDDKDSSVTAFVKEPSSKGIESKTLIDGKNNSAPEKTEPCMKNDDSSSQISSECNQLAEKDKITIRKKDSPSSKKVIGLNAEATSELEKTAQTPSVKFYEKSSASKVKKSVNRSPLKKNYDSQIEVTNFKSQSADIIKEIPITLEVKEKLDLDSATAPKEEINTSTNELNVIDIQKTPDKSSVKLNESQTNKTVGNLSAQQTEIGSKTDESLNETLSPPRKRKIIKKNEIEILMESLPKGLDLRSDSLNRRRREPSHKMRDLESASSAKKTIESSRPPPPIAPVKTLSMIPTPIKNPFASTIGFKENPFPTNINVNRTTRSFMSSEKNKKIARIIRRRNSSIRPSRRSHSKYAISEKSKAISKKSTQTISDDIAKIVQDIKTRATSTSVAAKLKEAPLESTEDTAEILSTDISGVSIATRDVFPGNETDENKSVEMSHGLKCHKLRVRLNHSFVRKYWMNMHKSKKITGTNKTIASDSARSGTKSRTPTEQANFLTSIILKGLNSPSIPPPTPSLSVKSFAAATFIPPRLQSENTLNYSQMDLMDVSSTAPVNKTDIASQETSTISFPSEDPSLLTPMKVADPSSSLVRQQNLQQQQPLHQKRSARLQLLNQKQKVAQQSIAASPPPISTTTKEPSVQKLLVQQQQIPFSPVEPKTEIEDEHLSSAISSQSLPTLMGGSLPAEVVDNSGTRLYSFLHPAKYNRSHGAVLLDYCCPNLDGPMPAIDPTRDHSQVQTLVRELPACIVMTTKVITRADLEAENSSIPSSIRKKMEKLASTSTSAVGPAVPHTQPVAVACAAALATTASTVSISAYTPSITALQKQLPPTTTLTPKMPPLPLLATGITPSTEISPNTVGTGTVSNASAAMPQKSDYQRYNSLRSNLRRFDSILKKYSPRICVLSYSERQRILESIINHTQLSPKDIENATSLLDNYCQQIGSMAAPIKPISNIATPTINTPTHTTATHTIVSNSGSNVSSAPATCAVVQPSPLLSSSTPLTTQRLEQLHTSTVQKVTTAATTGTVVQRKVPIYDKDRNVIGYQMQVAPATTSSTMSPRSVVMSSSQQSSTPPGVAVKRSSTGGVPAITLKQPAQESPRIFYTKPLQSSTPISNAEPATTSPNIIEAATRLGRNVTIRHIAAKNLTPTRNPQIPQINVGSGIRSNQTPKATLGSVAKTLNSSSLTPSLTTPTTTQRVTRHSAMSKNEHVVIITKDTDGSLKTTTNTGECILPDDETNATELQEIKRERDDDLPGGSKIPF